MSGSTSSKVVVAAMLSPLLVILLTVTAVAGAVQSASGSGTQPGSVCGLPALDVGDPIVGESGSTLQANQFANAQTIYGVSQAMGLSDQAAVDGITAALEASGLDSDPGGTSPDVIGLFGQSVARGWGTAAQLSDPIYTSGAFYNALITLANWQGLPADQAAAQTQQIGTPTDYTSFITAAQRLVSTMNGAANACAQDSGYPTGLPDSGGGLPAGYQIPANTPPQVVTALEYAFAQLGKPYIYGGDGPVGYDCSGLVMMAYEAAGIQLDRTTYQQVSEGTAVYQESDIQAGDLVFIMGSDPEGSLPGHVGMYIGSGYLIQAPHTGTKIEVIPLSEWNGTIVAMRDIVPWQ